MTIVCKAMEFGQFPLDSHNCYFIMTSCKLRGSWEPDLALQVGETGDVVGAVVATEIITEYNH